LRGTIAEFDEAKGYGTIRTEDGRDLFFHCTQIADGTRTIPAGAQVIFEIVPGHNGRWEATEVSYSSPPSSPPSPPFSG
jgi:cold shock CspA family protein